MLMGTLTLLNETVIMIQIIYKEMYIYDEKPKSQYEVIPGKEFCPRTTSYLFM